MNRLAAVVTFLAVSVSACAAYSFPFNDQLQQQLRERSERAREVEHLIPEDNFGHSGWKRYIALKGDRRITFGGLRFTTNTGDVCVRFAAYKLTSGEPFVTDYWQLWLGKNFDLAEDQARGTFILKDRPPAYKLRAWASRNDNVVFYLTGDPLSSGQACM